MTTSEAMLPFETLLAYCWTVMLILVLVLKDSLRTYFKSLSLSWSLGGQVLVLVLILGGQVLVHVLDLGGQVLVNILAAGPQIS